MHLVLSICTNYKKGILLCIVQLREKAKLSRGTIIPCNSREDAICCMLDLYAAATEFASPLRQLLNSKQQTNVDPEEEAKTVLLQFAPSLQETAGQEALENTPLIEIANYRL